MIRYLCLGTPWRRVLGLSMIAAGLMAGVAAAPGLLWPVQGMTVGLLAAGAAWCVDEPAAAVVDTLPRSLRWRTAARALAACPLGVLWVLSTLLWRRELPPHTAVLTLQGIAAMTVAVAYGAWRRAHGAALPGTNFAVASVTGCVALTLIPTSAPGPWLFPTFTAGRWQTCGAVWTCALSGSSLVLCATLRTAALGSRCGPPRVVAALLGAALSPSRHRPRGRVPRPHR